MKKLFLRDQKGFTLIELLIVIAIIAILASLAIPQYMKYQRKARVSSYAEPIARACLMDIASYCVENPTDQNFSNANLPNCAQSSTTAGGEVTLTVATGTCDINLATLRNSSVIGALANVNDYSAKCSYENNSIKCTIQ